MADAVLLQPLVGAALGLIAGVVAWRITIELARARGLAVPAGAPLWIGLAGAFGALSLFRFGAESHGAALVVLGAIAFSIAAFDFAHRRIPNEMSLALALLGLADAVATGPLVPRVLAGIVGALLLWGMARLYALIRRREGLGLGDVKLVVGLGFWLGPVGLVWGFLGASVATALFAVLALLRGPLADDPPFGPGLLAAMLVLLMTGGPGV